MPPSPLVSDEGERVWGMSYEMTKMTLEEQEKSNPVSFLSVEGNYWTNLISESVVEGDISSTAKIAKFKDTVIKVKYYTI